MNDTIIPEVEKLIRVCRDGEASFRQAASVATSEHLNALFVEYTEQWHGFATELQTEVAAFGADGPNQNGSAAGSARRGWIKLRDTVFTPRDQTLLEDCQRQAVSARDAYRSAVEAKDLPDSLRNIVARQYAEITAADQYLRDLREGAAPGR